MGEVSSQEKINNLDIKDILHQILHINNLEQAFTKFQELFTAINRITQRSEDPLQGNSPIEPSTLLWIDRFVKGSLYDFI